MRESSRKPVGRPRRRHAQQKVSVLIVDDHELILHGLRLLLESEDDMLVVGEARNGRKAVEMVRALKPAVVVMDIAMPGLNGLEATRQILAAVPTTRVLILSAHSDEEYVEQVMGLGAAGYVLKESSLDDLATAIRTVSTGKTFVNPAISRRLSGGVGATPGVWSGLTPREAEVLQLVAESKANKQVAAELHISIKTVEKHRQSLMTKLDIHDVAGLTRYAISIGTIEGRDRSATP